MKHNLQQTVTAPITFERFNQKPHCETHCPNCDRVMVRVQETDFRQWCIDRPGIQVYCSGCHQEWIVDNVLISLRRVK